MRCTDFRVFGAQPGGGRRTSRVPRGRLLRAPGHAGHAHGAPGSGHDVRGWQTDTVATRATLTLPMTHPYDVTAVYLLNQVIATQDAVDELLGLQVVLQQRDFLDQLGNRTAGTTSRLPRAAEPVGSRAES